MTDDEFKLFRDLVHRECGIFLKESKKGFLKSKIDKRLSALSISGYFPYYRLIGVERDQAELRAFLDSVTINETSFFRNTPQFEMFRDRVLPEIAEAKRKAKEYRLTVWSAGCSTGEEPYSIAMEVLEAIPDSIIWDIKVLASDISLRCLEIAGKGAYREERLKDVPEKYVLKHFKRNGDAFEVKGGVRKLVVFDYHNLMHENGMSNIDIVFCRNVMIYFEPDEQERLVRRFSAALNPGGYLFLGHAETLQGVSPNGDFRFHYWNKGAAYQRTEETHG